MTRIGILCFLIGWIMCSSCTNQANMGYVPVSGEGKIYYEKGINTRSNCYCLYVYIASCFLR